MSRKLSRGQPSPVYVFVVLSLAAFLAMFMFCRQPGITYEVQTTFQSSAEQLSRTNWEDNAKLCAYLLDSEFVLNAMRNADIIDCEISPETLQISQRIADRIHVRSTLRDDQIRSQLALVTHRPRVGMKLLDSMVRDMVTHSRLEDVTLVTRPATVSRQRGGSISSARLGVMCLASGLVGILGLLLARQSRSSSILFTREQIHEIAGITVVADFSATKDFPAQRRHQSRRRVCNGMLRLSEVAVAAVFLLIAFNLATRQSFLGRFVSDPFAAYGEVLTRVIG